MTDLTPDVVITLPPCVTDREAQAVALFVEQAMAAAVARDREALVERIDDVLALVVDVWADLSDDNRQIMRRSVARILAIPEAQS
jgi:UDP-N-acetylglucosamine:LPS N-acetylglucosamine transferase